MKCVVPLAGPDLVHSEHRFRAWVPYDGIPVLQAALEMRAWRRELKGSDYIFVVRTVPGVEQLETWLSERWNGCKVVRLSHLTGGALFSSLAGVAMLEAGSGPIVVDLADILFRSGPADLSSLFSRQGLGAVVPCFSSTEPCYSYLRMENGAVVEAAEKRVISEHASAGVYMFQGFQTFLRAAAHSVTNFEKLSYKGSLFVCPMVNGVLADGLSVEAPLLSDVTPFGKIFHSTMISTQALDAG
jgi:hypothetical protein